MWVEVLSVGGGGDHISRSTGGGERELASLSSVGDNAEDCVGSRHVLWLRG